MSKKHRYLLTVDADSGVIDKIEHLGEAGDLTEVSAAEFPMVPVAGHRGAPPTAGGGNVVIHVYAGSHPPAVQTHGTAATPQIWPGTQTVPAAATSPQIWPGTQTAQAASSPQIWPGTQTAQAASSPMGWPGTQTPEADDPSAGGPTAWPGPVTRAQDAEPTAMAAEEPTDSAADSDSDDS